MRLQRFLSLWYETPKVCLSLVRDFAGWPLSGMRRRGLASLSKSHRWLASRARDVEGRTVAGTRSRRSDSLVYETSKVGRETSLLAYETSKFILTAIGRRRMAPLWRRARGRPVSGMIRRRLALILFFPFLWPFSYSSHRTPRFGSRVRSV
jgi:hypothetical protein